MNSRGGIVTTSAPERDVPAPVQDRDRGRTDDGVAPQHPWTRVLPGILFLATGLGAAFVGHALVDQVGVLTWAVGLGVVAANVGLVPESARSGLGLVTKRLLRVGIVLLGFSVSFAAVGALGLPLLGVIAGSLVATLLFTTWLGRRAGLSPSRALLLGTGTAICGASAIAAMEDTAGADEEDVTVAIAMVTLFGTLALVLLPLLQGPLGLTDLQFGIWTGASVHEVGQVVAAASPAGAAVVATAIVVKLTRVLMLAPVVATVSAVRRFRRPAAAGSKRPPLVPLFVLGFIACAAVRTTGVVPAEVLGWITHVQVAALGAALFGMGAGVRIASLLKGSGPVLVASAAGSLFIGLATLGGLLVVTQ
jgi:uncharacterized integral membrane protein (TIGR00698 family)